MLCIISGAYKVPSLKGIYINLLGKEIKWEKSEGEGEGKMGKRKERGKGEKRRERRKREGKVFEEKGKDFLTIPIR